MALVQKVTKNVFLMPHKQKNSKPVKVYKSLGLNLPFPTDPLVSQEISGTLEFCYLVSFLSAWRKVDLEHIKNKSILLIY